MRIRIAQEVLILAFILSQKIKFKGHNEFTVGHANCVPIVLDNSLTRRREKMKSERGQAIFVKISAPHPSRKSYGIK
jgi:hypothetical protein